MRKSLADISFMVRDIPYPGEIPQELRHLHCYLTDSGHCLLCVPESLTAEAAGQDIQLYEVPLPVKYVLSAGARPIPGTDSFSVPVPYDDFLGAVVPDGFDEF